MRSPDPDKRTEQDDDEGTGGGFEVILLAIATADTSQGPQVIRCSDGVVFTVYGDESQPNEASS
jgi:hypothetical protein